jgi:hypothetical protein
VEDVTHVKVFKAVTAAITEFCAPVLGIEGKRADLRCERMRYMLEKTADPDKSSLLYFGRNLNGAFEQVDLRNLMEEEVRAYWPLKTDEDFFKRVGAESSQHWAYEYMEHSGGYTVTRHNLYPELFQIPGTIRYFNFIFV